MFRTLTGTLRDEFDMARTVYAPKLRNRTSRLRLPIRKKPYKALLAPGIHLCYRRNAGPGTWSVETQGWLKRFAIADDHEDANNASVMSYWQAQKQALKLVRGSETDSDKPITVAQALDAYRTDLEIRGGAKYNMSGPRNHMTPAMLTKPVALLSQVELANWRNDLVTEAGLVLASANRYGKSLAAALTLAAKRDKRITNAAAWKNGLKPMKAKGGNNPPRVNYYLSDAAITAIVRACYDESDDFGALIHVLAVTGTRESQALRIWPADLRDDDASAPLLMLWCSHKGGERDPEQRALPITPTLAKTLRNRAIARGNRPLFDRIWNIAVRFRVVLKRLGLDETLSPYVLRHSSVIRQIRSNTPLRLIAYSHDTSTQELERTYARYLDAAADDLRRGLLADAEPLHAKIVPLTR